MNFSEIVKLSVQQRIVLVDAIWESITADRRKTPLDDQEIEAAEQRIRAVKKTPSYLNSSLKIKSNIKTK